MITLDAILLSNTTNEALYAMTLECIRTLLEAEAGNPEVEIKVILLESNAEAAQMGFLYPQPVEVLVPKERFNFNRFLNFGIARGRGEYIALCNNDLLFSPHWFSEILKVKAGHPEFRSFCPVDPAGPYANAEEFKRHDFLPGYDVRKHIAGWCIVLERPLLEVTGPLDEQFDFYYADDDYAMTLRKWNVPHALVARSRVQHLEGRVSEAMGVKQEPAGEASLPKGLPSYLYTEGYRWILQNEKMLEGHLAFHQKWGSPRKIALKNRVWSLLGNLGLGKLGKWLY